MENYIEVGKFIIEVGLRLFLIGISITLVMVTPSWIELVSGSQVVLKWGLVLVFGGSFMFTIGFVVPIIGVFLCNINEYFL
jgi:hypothetical protein